MYLFTYVCMRAYIHTCKNVYVCMHALLFVCLGVSFLCVCMCV